MGDPCAIQNGLLQCVLFIGAKMPHQGLHIGGQRTILVVRQRAADGVVYPARGKVINGQPPRTPPVNYGNSIAPTGIVQGRCVPTPRVLNIHRAGGRGDLHVSGNWRRSGDTVGVAARISLFPVRAGNDPCTTRTRIDIGEIPDHHQAHGDIGKR